MELDEFVRNVIVQLCKGVNDAKEPAQEFGGAVNPVRVRGELADTHQRTAVEFDVAVGLESVSEGGGKAKISVFSIGADIGTSRQTTSSTTNRIRFTVPVLLPHTTGDRQRKGTQ
jgi:hypothetical protein